jgi:hypothetical protein
MSKQTSAYPLRLDETLSLKVKELAKLNDRTYRGQIENILKTYVAAYEAEHGELKASSD